MSQTPKIYLQIKYGDLEQNFSGELQEAWFFLNQFFKDKIPAFKIAQKLWLNVDLAQLARDFEGVVVFSVDGASLIIPKSKLTDNELLLVWLAGYYLGSHLGLVKNESVSKDELRVKLGKSGKITSTRLGELVKNEWVAKNDENLFKITTFGILRVQGELIQKIKAKPEK